MKRLMALNPLQKGFIGAAVLHGALLSLWLGSVIVSSVYRENLRLDFKLSLGSGTPAKSTGGAAAATATSASDAMDFADNEPATPAAANQPAQGKSSATGSSVASGYAGQNLSSISGMIQGTVYYPRIARRNNWQGKVVIYFVVGTDGKAHEVMLHESSGHEALDTSALETVRELAGLPKPPIPVALTVPVHFRLR